MVPPKRPGGGLIRRRPSGRSILIASAVVFLAANALYVVKSLLHIDFFPGHHGGFFPLGDWLDQALDRGGYQK